MKVVDLGHGTIAIEPDAPEDRIDSLSTNRLRKKGVSEESIEIYRQYIQHNSSTRIPPGGAHSTLAAK